MVRKVSSRICSLVFHLNIGFLLGINRFKRNILGFLSVVRRVTLLLRNCGCSIICQHVLIVFVFGLYRYIYIVAVVFIDSYLWQIAFRKRPIHRSKLLKKCTCLPEYSHATSDFIVTYRSSKDKRLLPKSFLILPLIIEGW